MKDVSDNFREGKQEVRLRIKPAAEALGLTMADLGRQVRQAFYGEEAQRIQRGRDEVKVMVRYPREERRSLGDLEEMRIRTPSGIEVPFREVAEVDLGRGYATINRVDRRRAVNVTADVDSKVGNATEIIAKLDAEYLPKLKAKYPRVSYTWEGEQREQQETIGGILSGYPMALVMIYALLAIPFRSYLQPFIVMSAIPFGLVGAVLGHVMMGMDLTILSMFGLVALSGVVVNDNLVLVVFINRFREEGGQLFEAGEAGGGRAVPPHPVDIAHDLHGTDPADSREERAGEVSHPDGDLTRLRRDVRNDDFIASRACRLSRSGGRETLLRKRGTGG